MNLKLTCYSVDHQIVTLNFPNAGSPVMENILLFHEDCLFILIFVLILVVGLMLFRYFRLTRSVHNVENSFFEILWTSVPRLLILYLLIPSLEVLYFSERGKRICFSKNIKVVGHQWFWEYNFKFNSESAVVFPFEYDSYVVAESTLGVGDFRNLEVDLPLILPLGEPTRLVLSSADTIHSFFLPDLGLKVDCVPGRLNQAVVVPLYRGVFYGYCAELCGVNHRYMPITVEVVFNSSNS